MNSNRALLACKRIIEQSLPAIAAAVATLYFSVCPAAWLDLDFCSALSNAYLTFFSICFGFIFASLSVLLSINDKPVMRWLRRLGLFPTLISYHWSSVRWCLAGCVLGVIASFKPGWYADCHGALFLGIGVVALFSAWRIFRLFAKIVSGMIEENP